MYVPTQFASAWPLHITHIHVRLYAHVGTSSLNKATNFQLRIVSLKRNYCSGLQPGTGYLLLCVGTAVHGVAWV